MNVTKRFRVELTVISSWLQEMLKFFMAQQNKLTVPSPAERPLRVTMSTSSLYGTDIVVEEHRELVDKIARHVVYGMITLLDSQLWLYDLLTIVKFVRLQIVRYQHQSCRPTS